VWRGLVRRLGDAGFNALVIDLGDGVAYRSHPELAVEGAWTCGRLRDELDFIRDCGLIPLPKLNFSTCHDQWLGPYSRRVSTPEYYTVCSDLITEVSGLFMQPPLFHLGMDEENYENQAGYEYVVVRQHELWWHDLRFLVKQVEKQGVRAWVWADPCWDNMSAYCDRMPRSVLQSNWYYGTDFTATNPCADAYAELERAGYDQIPTGSNWSSDENILKTVQHAATRASRPRLRGFLTAPWLPSLPECVPTHERAIEQTRVAIDWWQAQAHA
jgi:hypothetical protein